MKFLAAVLMMALLVITPAMATRYNITKIYETPRFLLADMNISGGNVTNYNNYTNITQNINMTNITNVTNVSNTYITNVTNITNITNTNNFDQVLNISSDVSFNSMVFGSGTTLANFYTNGFDMSDYNGSYSEITCGVGAAGTNSYCDYSVPSAPARTIGYHGGTNFMLGSPYFFVNDGGFYLDSGSGGLYIDSSPVCTQGNGYCGTPGNASFNQSMLYPVFVNLTYYNTNPSNFTNDTTWQYNMTTPAISYFNSNPFNWLNNTTADNRYLQLTDQRFNETSWVLGKNYLTLFTEQDPVWANDKASYATQSYVLAQLAAITATFLPVSVNLDTGTLTAGNIGSLNVTEDSNYYNITESMSSPPIQVNINFTNVNSTFNKIQLREWYNGFSTHTVSIQLYNWLTSNWVSFGSFTDQIDFTYVEASVSNSTPYINSTNGTIMRLVHSASGSLTHYLYIDYAILKFDATGTAPTTHDSLLGRDNETNHPWAIPKTTAYSTFANQTQINNSWNETRAIAVFNLKQTAVNASNNTLFMNAKAEANLNVNNSTYWAGLTGVPASWTIDLTNTTPQAIAAVNNTGLNVSLWANMPKPTNCSAGQFYNAVNSGFLCGTPSAGSGGANVSTTACSGTDKVSGINNATGAVTCTSDQTSAGGSASHLVSAPYLSTTKTNIGTAQVVVFAAPSPELNFPINFSGYTQYRIVYTWDYIGSGTEWLVWQNTTHILYNVSVVADAFPGDTGWLAIPSIYNTVNDQKIYWYANSSTAGDDPVGKGYAIYLR